MLTRAEYETLKPQAAALFEKCCTAQIVMAQDYPGGFEKQTADLKAWTGQLNRLNKQLHRYWLAHWQDHQEIK
jgi:hypothetical protein